MHWLILVGVISALLAIYRRRSHLPIFIGRGRGWLSIQGEQDRIFLYYRPHAGYIIDIEARQEARQRLTYGPYPQFSCCTKGCELMLHGSIASPIATSIDTFLFSFASTENTRQVAQLIGDFLVTP
jgi:hypothetical protein